MLLGRPSVLCGAVTESTNFSPPPPTEQPTNKHPTTWFRPFTTIRARSNTGCSQGTLIQLGETPSASAAITLGVQNVQQSIGPGEEYLLSFQRRRLYYSFPLPPIVRQLPIPSFLSSSLHYALLPLPLFREEGEGERKQTRNSLSSLSLFFAAPHYVEWRRLGIIGSWCVVFVHVVFLFFHLLPFFGLNNLFVVSFLSSRRERFFKSL